MSEWPVLDDRVCTGCGDCVAICPTDCLEMNDAIPWLPRPTDCISCAACVVVCPADALSMRPAAEA